MNGRWARLLIRLYPRQWRERYGEEFEELLRSGVSDARTTCDVVSAAFAESLWPTQGGNMDQQLYTFGTVTRQPSALAPLAMSVTALVMVLGAVAMNHGPIHEADEGAIAHIWQILMALQLPALAFFAIRWLGRALRPTLGVLALQVGVVLANLAAVFFLT
jgi:hypothetical protein